MATPDGKTKLIVDIPINLKNQFKGHCALNGIAMTELIESLIRDYLNRNQKGAV